jgi:hypothetical protein
MQSYQDVKRCVGTGVAALAAGVAVVSIGAAAGEAFMAHELVQVDASRRERASCDLGVVGRELPALGANRSQWALAVAKGGSDALAKIA